MSSPTGSLTYEALDVVGYNIGVRVCVVVGKSS